MKNRLTLLEAGHDARAAEGPAGGALVLKGKCEDVDEVSGADFMGQFEVDLTGGSDGSSAALAVIDAAHGEGRGLQCAIRSQLDNSRLDFCPFDGFVDEHEGDCVEGRRLGRRRA